jgi:hypothetical protein
MSNNANLPKTKLHSGLNGMAHPRCLAIDVATIIAVSHPPGKTQIQKKGYLHTPIVENACLTCRQLNTIFGSRNVFIFGRVGENIEERYRHWLQFHRIITDSLCDPKNLFFSQDIDALLNYFVEHHISDIVSCRNDLLELCYYKISGKRLLFTNWGDIEKQLLVP